MIVSFADKVTKSLFERETLREIHPDVQRAALRKLIMLHAACVLNDLRIPPGNRLEALKGNRAGQHSIRVNDQFRIVFRWENDNAHDVQFIDYH
ncbi:plasmid maintenance system killer protein [Phycisphaerae bacterium]|nr:plasmid maintenance system killer protein [Phycisphaerae bacterium]